MDGGLVWQTWVARGLDRHKFASLRRMPIRMTAQGAAAHFRNCSSTTTGAGVCLVPIWPQPNNTCALSIWIMSYFITPVNWDVGVPLLSTGDGPHLNSSKGGWEQPHIHQHAERAASTSLCVPLRKHTHTHTHTHFSSNKLPQTCLSKTKMSTQNIGWISGLKK